MSAVIFATDPTGNNNPFLKITSQFPIFLVIESIGSIVAQNNLVVVHRSTDGFNWTSVTLPYFVGPLVTGQYAYGNGIFAIVCTLAFSSDVVALTSTDGIGWTVASTGGLLTVAWDQTNNQIQVLHNLTVVATVPSPLAPNTITTFYLNRIDNAGNPHGVGPFPDVPSNITNFDINNPLGGTGFFEVSTDNAASYTSVLTFDNDGSVGLSILADILG